MSKKTIVFGKTKKAAYSKLSSMLSEMIIGDLSEVDDNGRDLSIKLKNGDTYEIAIANESAKGMKCDYIQVDQNVEISTLIDILLPLVSNDNNIGEETLSFY